MTQPHPNLSPEINAAIMESELVGGVYVYNPGFGAPIDPDKILKVGGKLKITTQNSVYILERVLDDSKISEYKRGPDFLISGHPGYCPTPTPCYVSGSTWGGSMLKVGYVGRGMHLEVSIMVPVLEEPTGAELYGYDDTFKRLTTCRIREIQEL